MTDKRPSDRSIAAAFWEIRPSAVCDAIPFRRSVIERARELDATAAPVVVGEDGFDGDNAKLLECIDALLSLDAAGALAPHGIGGHARALLKAAAARIKA